MKRDLTLFPTIYPKIKEFGMILRTDVRGIRALLAESQNVHSRTVYGAFRGMG